MRVLLFKFRMPVAYRFVDSISSFDMTSSFQKVILDRFNRVEKWSFQKKLIIAIERIKLHFDFIHKTISNDASDQQEKRHEHRQTAITMS